MGPLRGDVTPPSPPPLPPSPRHTLCCDTQEALRGTWACRGHPSRRTHQRGPEERRFRGAKAACSVVLSFQNEAPQGAGHVEVPSQPKPCVSSERDPRAVLGEEQMCEF